MIVLFYYYMIIVLDYNTVLPCYVNLLYHYMIVVRCRDMSIL